MLFRNISVLILLLSSVLNNIVDGCVPVNTPWTGMCEAGCRNSRSRSVTLSGCNQTTLLSGSYSGGNDVTDFYFKNSGITDVSSRAFSALTLRRLELTHSFAKFEPEAFAGLTVASLSIKDNPKLTSLPSGVFRGVDNLKGLFLNNNNLQSLPGDLFRGMGDLIDLKVSGNSISCFHHELFHPFYSYLRLSMKQNVDIRGLCPKTFKEVKVDVEDYEVKIDQCVVGCGELVTGLRVLDASKSCDCDSYEGCLDCVTGTTVTEELSVTKTVVTADKKVTDVRKHDVVTALTTDYQENDLENSSPTRQPSSTVGGAMKRANTGRIMLIVYPVMIMICEFDF